LDKKERLKKAQESHYIDEDVVRAIAATNNIKIVKSNSKIRKKGTFKSVYII